MNNLITVTHVVPSADAVEEVQVQNGNYTAQYGSYMGVHVNLASKSGTNGLHGALFEFVRNDMFDAHSFFDSPRSPKKPLHVNQFGLQAGGPVYLPKLYDGRNKTFFTASYEGLRQIKSPSQLGTTLTQAMRGGDFSSLCTRSEEHTSELQSRLHLVCRLLLEKKKTKHISTVSNIHTALIPTYSPCLIRRIPIAPCPSIP